MSSPLKTIDLDYQFQTSKFNIVVNKDDTPVIRAYLYQNAEPWQPTSDYTCQLAYTNGYETNNAPFIVTGDVSTSQNYVEFIFNTNVASITTTDYYSQVVLLNNSAGNELQYVFGDGMIRVKRSPIGHL